MPTRVVNQQANLDNEQYPTTQIVDEFGDPAGVTGNGLKVTIADGKDVDSFSRFRGSAPFVVFEASFIYGQRDHLFTPVPSLGGTITDNLTDSSIALAVPVVVGAKAQNFSSRCIRYQPGRSLEVLLTGNFNGPVVGVEKRIGLGDQDDAMQFYVDGTETGVLIRSSSTGAPITTKFPQSTWNLDKMDGSGHTAGNPSGITLDVAKAQIFVIDYQWLGVGRVRFGFNIDGILYYVHEVNHANIDTTVYLSQPNMWILYEVENITGANTADLKQICSAGFSEGGYETVGELRSHSNVGTPVTVANGVETPIFSLRPAALVNGRTNKSTIVLLDLMLVNLGLVPIHWTAKEDATLAGTGAGYVAEVNIIDGTVTLATQGREVNEGFIPATGRGSNELGSVKSSEISTTSCS